MACYNTIPSNLLNATYGPSAFEAGIYGNKFDLYANNTFGRNVVPPTASFGGVTNVRPCVSVCPGINFPVCCPVSYERVAVPFRGMIPSTFEGRFGFPSTWAELARCYPSTWERNVVPTTYGYPSWALNERIPSTWGYDNVPSTWNTWNNVWSPREWLSTSANLVNSSLCNVAFRPSHPVEMYSLTNPIRVLDREGNRMLWLCYELKGFKPEEITCTLNKAERAIIVEAAHEIKEGKEHHILRKFSRKFVLPESLAKIDLAKIELKSSLNNEGFLTIECVLPKMTVEEIAKCPVMAKINEMPFYGRTIPSEVANCFRPVTVKTA